MPLAAPSPNGHTLFPAIVAPPTTRPLAPSTWKRVAVALAAAAAATGAAAALEAAGTERGQFACAVVAVLVATAYGGVSCGVVASFTSMVGLHFAVISPTDPLSFSAEEFVSLAVMAGTTAIGGVIYERARTGQQRAEALAANLEEVAAALRVSETRWRQVAEAIPAMTNEATAGGAIIYFSRRWTDYTGLTSDELLARWPDVIHPDDVSRVMEEREKAIPLGLPFSHQWRARARDGSYRWHLGYASPVKDADDRVVSWVGTSVDIEEMKRGERLLRNQANLLDQTHDAVLVWGFDDGGIRYWNTAAETLYGYRASEARGRRPHELLASVHEQPFEIAEHILESSGAWDGIIDQTSHDGRRIMVESRRVLVTEPDGQRVVLEVNRDVTERVRADEILRASETRWRGLAEAVPALIFEMAPDGRMLYFNERAIQFTGRTLQELLGHGYLEAIHPDDVGQWKADWEEARASGKAITHEHRLRRHDGTYSWHLAYGVPMRGPDGDITSWLGVKVDIDERRRAEEELRASQEQFRSLVAAVPANVFLHAMDGVPLFANDRWLAYVGLTFEEAMVRDRYYQLVHPEDRQRLIDEWARATGEVSPTRMEFRMRRHDGVYRWHLSDALPLRDESGAVSMWLTVSIDIDDQKRAHDEIRASEQRMRESVARYEALIAAAPSFVFLTDAAGTHTWSSPGYAEYVGLPPEEAGAWKWLDREVVHRDDAAELTALWESAIATGEPFEMDVRLRGADDVFRWHLHRVAPVRDEAGAITGWVGTSTNIDASKRAEEIVRASETRLRAVVETAVDGIMTFDESGTIESWNPAAARIFGYAADEALGQSVRMLVPPADRERREAITPDALLGETSDGGPVRETTGRRRDGSSFPMELAISETSIGGRRLFTTLVRDVTERRHAEDALRASEERFRLAAAASRIGAWEWDLGTTVRWSDSMEEIYGFERGGFGGTFEAFMAHVHPDDRDLTMRAVNRALASGEELDFEHRIVLPDGTLRWLNGRGRLIRDAAGQPVRMAGIGMDVTERKESQAELTFAEERLRLATEGAQFGMWDWHRRENRVYCSERELELFGVEEGVEMTSEMLMERVHPDDREAVGQQLRDAVERNATCELEFRVVHPDGSVRWLAGWAVSISDMQGGAARLIGLNADITSRKRQERDQQFLADLGTALQQSLEHDVLVREILACTLEGFAQFCALYLRDGNTVRRYTIDPDKEALQVETSSLGARESFPVARALMKGKETLLPEINERELHASVASVQQEAMFRAIKLSSAIVVPLRAGGEVTGALSLAASTERPPFDEADLEMAREIAQRVTLALENARLYERSARDTLRAKTLASLASLLAGSIDYATTFREAAAICVPAIADSCAIDVLDDAGRPQRIGTAYADDGKVALATEMGRRWLAPTDAGDSAHGVWYAIGRGEPELVEEFSPDLIEAGVGDERLRQIIQELGVRSSLSVPLIARSRTLGAVTFLMSESGRNFERADLPYFEEIGRRVALAVDSAALYRAEREAQEALAERVAELETLLDNVPVGIAIAHDAACSRITANEEFNRMLRTPAGANVSKSAEDGANWFRISKEGQEVRPEDLPMQRAASTGEPVLGEVLDIEFADGSPGVREIGSALPLFGADGAVRGAIGVFMDITDRLRVEDELRRALATKDDFLGMVSHELKTPITMVRGNAEILLRRGDMLDDETRKQSIADILIDSERLQSIIENLLVLARLEHAPELPSEPLYIARFVERFVEDYNRRISGRQIIVTDTSDGAVVTAEPMYLEQVLRNLLSNATKYSPPGEPIEICVEQDDRDARVRVMDRGPGVAADEAELIFTPFYRSTATSSQAHGVGVGLAVCKRMIEAQGGRMWCEPRDGGGGVFVFSLPMSGDDGSDG
jgi:PAS domain S-box-containing protein